jgi:hypothetical protein
MYSTDYIVQKAEGTSDFGAQMSGIKFWKGDENLRPVDKKPYEILSGRLHFRLFSK